MKRHAFAYSVTKIVLVACTAAATVATAADPPARSGEEFPPRTIFVMKPDGSGVRNVVFMEAFKWLDAPRWSHDGKRLVFSASGSQPARSLIVDFSGRNLVDLGAGTKPDWSPDDKQIL